MNYIQSVKIENVKVWPVEYHHAQGKSIGYNVTYLRNGIPNSARFNHFVTVSSVKAWLERVNKTYQEDVSGL